MTVDIKSRQRIIEERRNNNFLNTLLNKIQDNKQVLDVTEPIRKMGEASNTQASVSLLILKTFRNLQNILLEIAKQLPSAEDISTLKLNTLVKEIRALAKELSVVRFPKKLETFGKVEITNFPANNEAVTIVEAVNNLRREMPMVLKEAVKVKTTTTSTKIDFKPVLEALSDLREAISDIPQPEINYPREISVNNFPAQLVPQPVTNINLNPLRGFAHTTSVTVGTTVTPLPSYGVLNNRRTLMIYNNGTNTVFIGGSDITSNNGLPIIGSSFSPAIDAGPKLIIYGITSSGTSDVRVFEISNDNIGA